MTSQYEIVQTFHLFLCIFPIFITTYLHYNLCLYSGIKWWQWTKGRATRPKM